MKLGEIIDRLMPMLEDARWAEELLEKDDSQYSRRAYIRSYFALLEGSIWIFKQAILHAPTKNGKAKRMSPAEYALLSDKTYDLKRNGKTKEQTKYLKLPENFRFTFGVLEKYFGAKSDLGLGTSKWDNFLKAQSIRNRITHPKTSDEFEVSDNEIEICKEVCSWSNELFNDVLSQIVKNSKGK